MDIQDLMDAEQGALMERVIKFNQTQLKHVSLVQELTWEFCQLLMKQAIEHDASKFSAEEYEAFLNSQESLAKAKSGTDEDYQKHFKSDAIQHHVLNNPHHPEYWDAKEQEMPLECVISMFFDWLARTIQKGGNLEDFWEYNLAKLEKQPRAKAVVELLRKYCGVLVAGVKIGCYKHTLGSVTAKTDMDCGARHPEAFQAGVDSFAVGLKVEHNPFTDCDCPEHVAWDAGYAMVASRSTPADLVVGQSLLPDLVTVAFTCGFNSFNQGISRGTNPYTEDALRREWYSGFDAASAAYRVGLANLQDKQDATSNSAVDVAKVCKPTQGQQADKANEDKQC